jgi:phytoene desaturase
MAQKSSKKIIVIGSGFAGLSCASILAKNGHKVTLLEKNPQIGGRARVFEAQGFTFDMGPSWYWMPEVFENFLGIFGKKASDFYELVRLSPSYQVFWKDNTADEIPAEMDKLEVFFERYQSGGAAQLQKFLSEAQYKYRVGMDEFVWKPSLKISEFIDLRLLINAVRIDMFKSIRSHIHKSFSHPKLRELLEFPVLFLGATPSQTPALYSMMNYADMALGTWYPLGGMGKVIDAFAQIARSQGVEIITDCAVDKIEIQGNISKGVWAKDQFFQADVVVSGADYEHTDQKLLPASHRNYSQKYWQSRSMAPSSLLYYLGINKKLNGLLHHNLFFDEDFDQHAKEIYQKPDWPSKPLFYACLPSQTDASVAPEGMENLFLLIPVATGLQDDSQEVREKYLQMVLERLEKKTGQTIAPHIIYKRTFAHREFISDYNAFKGNAYGLANTLTQTAILKPRLQNRKVKNLFYTGQLTVPGPGVPPSIISGQVVAKLVGSV